MIFFAFTDQGLVTTPVEGATFTEAVANLKALFAGGVDANIAVGVLMPQLTGTLNPATGALTMSADAQAQATLRQQAGDALAANAAYLAIANPSAAQFAAQVRALTQQTNALIRLTVGTFS